MRKRWLSLLLAIVMGASIGLSYILIFDADFLVSRLTSESEDQVESDTEEEDSVNYFQPADFAVEEVFYPEGLYLHQEDQTYQWLDQEDLEEVLDLLSETPLRLEGLSVLRNADQIQELLVSDHLQLAYTTPIPVGMVSHLVDLPEDESVNFEFDRILIGQPESVQERPLAYLVNSLNDTYMEVSLDRQAPVQDWVQALGPLTREEAAVPVDRYHLRTGFVYLPDEEIILQEHLYTLDRVSETQMIRSVFPNSDYVLSPGTTNSVRSYHNPKATLTIYTSGQTMSLITNRAKAPEQEGTEDRLRENFDLIRRYDYWNNDLRYCGEANGIYTYRRYLNGWPTFTLSGSSNYSTSRIQMRDREITDVVRTQLPLIILQVEIPDFAVDHLQASGPEVVENLAQLGYPLTDLEDLTLGYEWQIDSEDLKIAQLVPTWFVQIEGRYYSLEQVNQGLDEVDQGPPEMEEGED